MEAQRHFIFLLDKDGRASLLFRIKSCDIESFLSTGSVKNDGFANCKPFNKSVTRHWWGAASTINGARFVQISPFISEKETAELFRNSVNVILKCLCILCYKD